ncbi:hypothetical protein DH2020_041382 [Rehmannia glutinosa]|uniref:Patatin n=1 Tax=Rehmannia glutinosa TaxID=99300 RepID=A0ABR0UQD0_REHGL
MVCDSDSEELLLEEKLAFMHETRHAFGRTALLLSGGASLGAFHVGVVKTLVEHKLLPRIIAGSSVGSIMCSVVATRSWPELQSFFEDSWHSIQFFDQMGGIFTVFKRVMTQGAVHEIRQLQIMLRHLTNNLTFQEAYDMTGRILGITVCSPRKHEPPRCLNYLTSPHVVIWSAVTASCAFPGLFEAQELMAKDRSGEIVPYHPPFHLGPEEASGASSRRWRDGSLEIDLPMMQLKELFNVNHFIVSQANPHIAPLLRVKEIVRAYGGNFAAKLAHLAEMEVKHRCNQILELGFPLGGLAKLFAQDWEGDVTVVMPATLAQQTKAEDAHGRSSQPLKQIVESNLLSTNASRYSTISSIEEECSESSRASHGLATTVRFNASKRIPSWNVIARENSTGSLEEDLLADVSSSLQQGVGGSSGRNWRTHRYALDGSDSESETADLNSWTRSGGPLMRTTSADKFVDFVQNLEVDSRMNRGMMGQMGGRDQIHQGLRVATPDRTGSLAARTDSQRHSVQCCEERSLDAEESRFEQNGSPHDSVAECVQLDSLEKEMGSSSASESGDDVGKMFTWMKLNRVVSRINVPECGTGDLILKMNVITFNQHAPSAIHKI